MINKKIRHIKTERMPSEDPNEKGKLLMQVFLEDGSVITPTNLEALLMIDGIFICEDDYRPKVLGYRGRDMFFSAIKRVHKGEKPEEVLKDKQYEKKYNKSFPF